MKNPADEYKRRMFLLKGKAVLVILSVTIPLLFHNSLNLIFSFFDTFTAANMNMDVVTTVSFISDIRIALGTITGGLSVGAGIMISRSFGNGDSEEVKRQISTVFFLTLFIGALILCTVIPLSVPILRFCAFPEELIPSGAFFLSISVITLILSFINTIFFAMEKARGRTKIVMYGNLVVLGIKTALNIVIIVLVSGNYLKTSLAMYLLPVASGIAYGVMTVIALKRMLSKRNIFHVSWKSVTFNKDFLFPLSKLSFPVFIEKFLIPFGKVICNGLYVGFGSVGLAAYACSQRILAFASTPLNSFKDAESIIVSANLGNRDENRAITIMNQTTVITLGTAAVLFAVVAAVNELLTSFFAKGNADLAQAMKTIYRIERWAVFFDAIDNALCGFLYARKKTKLPTIVNIVKLFGIRIPLFLLLTKIYGFGIEAIAWSILVSNGADALMSVIFTIHSVHDLKKSSAIEATNNERLSSAITLLGQWDAFDAGQTRRQGITVPEAILSQMKNKYQGTLSDREMGNLYKQAVVEQRIAELEKEEERSPA